MKTLLRDLGNVCVYMDDILVCGSTEGEHLATLNRVLERLQQAGFRLKLAKCVFNIPCRVLRICHNCQWCPPCGKGFSSTKGTRTEEHKSFLGMLNYYRKFLPHIASTLAPLHSLMQKNKSWTWGGEQQAAFSKAKDLLASTEVLVHYDPERKLLLACDASPYGIAAVLSHQMEDGSDRPIAYASRTLSVAEKKYCRAKKKPSADQVAN